MSLIFLVFMIVPIIAPSIGAGVAALAGWRAIFFVFAAMSLLMIAWLRRLPETLEPQDVRRLDWRTMIAGWLTVTRHRRAAGYMIASGLMQGALFGYLNSSEQRSEEDTSQLQPLMRISSAVLCLKKQK